MEAITKHLQPALTIARLEHQNLPTHLQQISKSLQPEELKLLNTKYSMPVISKMPSEQLVLHAQALLLKIHVITGWRIPENETLLAILQDQFYKKLVEDYWMVNVQEIEYAFRRFGTTIKDWGKDVNLNLIDTVLIQYLAERKSVSDIEEQIKQLPEKPKPSTEQVLSLTREYVEFKYQQFLTGKTSFNILPENGLATLAVDGFCDFNLKDDFVEKAMENIKKEKETLIAEYKSQGKLNLAANERKDIAELTTESASVIILSKKMALMYCFFRFKEAGYKNIYVEDQA